MELERAAFSDNNRVVLFADDEIQIDHFVVFQVPTPEEFKRSGRRRITVTLAYDPPTRNSRVDYLGVRMGFRLIRGKSPEQIFEHYRARPGNEEIPEIGGKYQCDLNPSIQHRERGTLQKASQTFSRDTIDYADDMYLVLRCQGGWAQDIVATQRYAVVVELEHFADVDLYARVRNRLRVRA